MAQIKHHMNQRLTYESQKGLDEGAAGAYMFTVVVQRHVYTVNTL